ncbi:hypothetical protein Misp02_66240 [Microtetraspora sp. NBRC 16547]|nr:hypothetical protein Misp02_66240 [Microtetraspora sp. NBRC 16547]
MAPEPGPVWQRATWIWHHWYVALRAEAAVLAGSPGARDRLAEARRRGRARRPRPRPDGPRPNTDDDRRAIVMEEVWERSRTRPERPDRPASATPAPGAVESGPAGGWSWS